jgi:hypothetical protein
MSNPAPTPTSDLILDVNVCGDRPHADHDP